MLQLIFILQVGAIVALLVVRYFPQEQLAATEKPGILSPLVFVLPSPSVLVPIFVPQKITIAALNLNLPVEPSQIVADEWMLYDDKVSWLTTSATIGAGNVILYAHNRKSLFGTLYQLKPGDMIEVGSGDKRFAYEVKMIHKVLPNDIGAVLSSTNQLILYTCDGRFDERRLVVVGEPKGQNLLEPV